jgi:hypothetical protein
MSYDRTMREFEVALLDALRTICEVRVAKGIISAEVLAEMLQRQRQGYLKEPPMEGAAFVMSMLLEPLADPARLAARKLDREPPQGSA